MKKVVSFLLSLVIIITSVILPYSLMSSAEEAETGLAWETVGITDFESEAQTAFFADKTNFSAGYANVDTEHGVSAQYNYISPVGINYGWLPYFALTDNGGSDIVALQTASSARISFDLNIQETTKEGYSFDKGKKFYAALVYANKKEVENHIGNQKGLDSLQTRVANITQVDPAALSNGWNRISGVITVPTHAADTKPYLVLYYKGENDRNWGTIYLDNVVVERQAIADDELRYTTIDFESPAQKAFYDNSSMSEYFTTYSNTSWQSAFKTVDNNTVWNVVRLSNGSSKQTAQNNVSFAAALTLTDNRGLSSLCYRYGDAFNISVDVKSNIASPKYDIFVGLVFDDSMTHKLGGVGDESGLYTYVNSERLYALGKLDATTNWQTVTCSVGVPQIVSDAQVPKLVLFTKSASLIENISIYVDNIVVSPYEYEKDFTVDFDSDSQYAFFDGKKNYTADKWGRFNANALIESKSGHGNIVTLRSFVDPTASSDNGRWPSCVALCNNDGKQRVFLKSGTTVEVTFDACIDTAYDSFCVGLTYDAPFDNDSGNLGGRTYGLNEAYTAGELTYLTKVPCIKEWRTYSATVTVPQHDESEYVWFVMYMPDNPRTDSQWVFFDNINIKTVDSTLVNFDTKSNAAFYAGECIQTYTTHGNTAVIDSLSATGAKGIPLAVRDNANLDINFATGSVLNAAVDVKLNRCDDTEVYAGIVFADKNENIDLTVTKPIEIGRLDTATNWQTLTAQITVTEHTAGKHLGIEASQVPMLVIYSKSALSENLVEQEILVDNIALSAGELPQIPLYGDVTGDGVVSIVDLVRMKRIFAGILEMDANADLDFDDCILASDLAIIKRVLLSDMEETINSDVLTEVDFDSANQPKFYSEQANRSVKIECIDVSYGNSAKFEYISPIGSVGYEYSNVKYLALSNASGRENLQMASSGTVTVSFDINVAEISNPLDTFKVGLIFLNEKDKSLLDGNNGLSGRETRIADVAELSVSELNDSWNTVTSTVKIPSHTSDAYPYIVLYQTKNYTRNICAIYIDNIVLEQTKYSEKELHYSKIDFDSNKQAEYYSGPKNDFFSTINYNHLSIESLSNEPSHGKVLAINSITGYSKGNSSNKPATIYMSNNSGTRSIQYEGGEMVNISLDVKNLTDNSDGIDFDVWVGIVFDQNTITNTGGWIADVGGLYQLKNDGKLLEFARIPMKNTDWQTVYGVISVPEHSAEETPKLVFYTKNKQNAYGIKILVDNITTSAYVFQESTSIDFDSNSQKQFYSIKKRFVDDNNDFGNYNAAAKIVADDTQHGNAVLFNQIHIAHKNGANESWWPNSVALTDTNGKYRFAVKPGAKMNVSVDVKAKVCNLKEFYIGFVYENASDSAVLGGTSTDSAGLYKYYSDGTLTDVVAVDGNINNWKTYSSSVYIPYHNSADFVWIVLYSKNESAKVNNQEILLDNIRINTETSSTFIRFETNGGKKLEDLHFFNGHMPVIPNTERENYYFEDWYTDRNLTHRFDYGTALNKSITLYARWTSLNKIKPVALSTGFEADDYLQKTVPYSNCATDESGMLKQTVSDQSNTEGALIFTDDPIAYNGKGSLFFNNFNYQTGEIRYHGGSNQANAAALLNPDGTNYKVVEGVRYHVKFAQWVNGVDQWAYKDTVIGLVATNRIPSKKNQANMSVLHEYRFSAEKFTDVGGQTGCWNVYEFYFEANTTGNLYLTMYCYNKESKCYFCRIDDFSIIPSTQEPITKVTFCKEDGTEKYSYLSNPGKRFEVNLAESKVGYDFNGWVDQNGKIFTGFSVPDKDITLYPTYRAADDLSNGAQIDWSRPVVCDFENTAGIRNFYGEGKNKGDPDRFGYYPVFENPQKSHSGSNSFCFEEAGCWLTAGNNRRFKLYTDNTPGNYIWLNANGRYKVTYYVKLIRQYDSVSRLYLCGFRSANENTDLEWYTYSEYRRTSAMNVDGWQKVEQTITVGNKSTILGFELWGGCFTAYIDDITVECVN